MKQLLSVLIFLSTWVPMLHAQVNQINWGEQLSVPEGGYNIAYLGIAGDYHYVSYINDYRQVHLRKYRNETRELIGDYALDYEHEGLSLYPIQILHTKKQDYLLYRSGKSDDMKRYYSAATLDHEEPKQAHLIFEHYQYLGWPIDIIVSKNKKHVAIICMTNSENKSGGKDFICAVFDSDLKLKWKQEISFSRDENGLKIDECVLANDGSLYLFAKSESIYSSPQLFKVYHLFENQKAVIQELNVPNGLILNDIAFLTLQSKELEFAVTGLYTTKEQKPYLAGSFFCGGTTNSGFENMKLNAFEHSFLSALKDDSSQKDNMLLSPKYRIETHHSLEDQGFVFIAEKHGSPSSPYGRGALVLSFYKSNGDLIRHQKVLKGTAKEHPNGSLFSFLNDNKLYLIFNDDKTEEEKKTFPNDGHKKPYSDFLIMDLKGEIIHRECFFNRSILPIWFSNYFWHVNEGTLWFPIMGHKSYIIGTMKL